MPYLWNKMLIINEIVEKEMKKCDKLSFGRNSLFSDLTFMSVWPYGHRYEGTNDFLRLFKAPWTPRPDCLHYCVPGAMTFWNQMLWYTLKLNQMVDDVL